MTDTLPPGATSAPSALRNRGPIATVLRPRLPQAGTVLEVASGSGEHAVYNAAAFPHLNWQPSDVHPAALASIAAWRAQAALPNLLAPVRIDAATLEEWPIARAEAVICINMIHISPWAASLGLMRGVARVLPSGGRLFLYGPYLEGDVETAPGNVEFDLDLKRRDTRWGLRRVADVVALAAEHGLMFEERIAMPANNLLLVFSRRSTE